MRNTFKATKIKGIFIAFQRLKNIDYYTLHNSRISYSFSALYKIFLSYLCYERLHYLHERRQERKKNVFR